MLDVSPKTFGKMQCESTTSILQSSALSILPHLGTTYIHISKIETYYHQHGLLSFSHQLLNHSPTHYHKLGYYNQTIQKGNLHNHNNYNALISSTTTQVIDSQMAKLQSQIDIAYNYKSKIRFQI